MFIFFSLLTIKSACDRAHPSAHERRVWRLSAMAVTCGVVARGVRRARVQRRRRVVEGVRLRRAAARAHEQLHRHGLRDVRPRVRRHAAD